MRKLKIGALPFLVLIALATTQCASNWTRIVDGLPAGINLTEAKSVEIRDGGGRVVLSGAFSSYKAPLANPGTNAKGLAEIEIEKVGANLKQEIEVVGVCRLEVRIAGVDLCNPTGAGLIHSRRRRQV